MPGTVVAALPFLGLAAIAAQMAAGAGDAAGDDAAVESEAVSADTFTWWWRRRDTTSFLSTPAPGPAPEPPQSTTEPTLPPESPGSTTQPTETSRRSLPFRAPGAWPPVRLGDPAYCTEVSEDDYTMEWEAKGTRFFDDWEFERWDSNNGAAQYLDRDQAVAEKVAEAHETHAVLRVGARGNLFKRFSAKLKTQKAWKYFLAAVRFTHVPVGCGLWPAFWTVASGVHWPSGGEIDIMEWANDAASQTSLHTAESNRCQLDADQVNKPGCPAMPDTNGVDYNCLTAYPDHLGCAPNKLPLQSPAEWNLEPVTFAVEWTEHFLKVWKIPDHDLPGDLVNDTPRPRQWDKWLVSYYPFRRSGTAKCPDPENVLAPQHLMLNIGLCGDWAGKIWGLSPTCNALHSAASGCRAVDPLMERNEEAHDCCTQFVWDGNNEYGADGYLSNAGFFNISWVKVFQRRRAELR